MSLALSFSPCSYYYLQTLMMSFNKHINYGLTPKVKEIRSSSRLAVINVCAETIKMKN